MTSLAAVAQFHDENRISRILTKAFLRLADMFRLFAP